MESPSPSIILGQRFDAASDETTVSDLQQLVGKVLSILRYRRWMFVVPLLTSAVICLVVSLHTPRNYLLRTVFERREDPVVSRLVANSPYNFETLRRSMRYNLIGYNAVDQAVRRMSGADQLRPSDPEQQKLVTELAGQLQVIVLDSSPTLDMVELRYLGESPQMGEQLVRQLRDNYFRDSQAMMLDIQKQAQKFFSDEVEKRRTRVAKMQAELSQLRMQQPDVDPSRPEYLSDRLTAENLSIEQLTRQKTELLGDLAAREEYLAKMQEQHRLGQPIPTVSTRLLNAPQRTRLETQIAQVVDEIADAKTVRRMKDAHPVVESLNKKLKQLHIEYERLPQEIAGATTATQPAASPFDSECERLTMEIKMLRGKLDPIERDIAKHQTEKGQLETQKATVLDRQQQFMLRQQELDTAKSDVAVWLSKLDEINRAMTAENGDRGTRFNTVEEVRRPSKPLTPKVSSTFMLSGGVSLAVAIVLVFLRELFDRSFRNPARVRQVLGIPVLETIEEILVRQPKRAILSRLMLRSLVVVETVAIVALAGLVYVSIEKPATYVQWMETARNAFSALAIWSA